VVMVVVGQWSQVLPRLLCTSGWQGMGVVQRWWQVSVALRRSAMQCMGGRHVQAWPKRGRCSSLVVRL
jgi:hypothetical protein